MGQEQFKAKKIVSWLVKDLVDLLTTYCYWKHDLANKRIETVGDEIRKKTKMKNLVCINVINAHIVTFAKPVLGIY